MYVNFNISIDSFREISDGFSYDKKFVINNEFIVRVNNHKMIDRFNEIYKFQKLYSEKYKSQKPIAVISDDEYVYLVLEFLQGEDGLKAIKRFSETEQYNIGFQAGKDLALFHKENIIEESDSKSFIEGYMKIKLANFDKHEISFKVKKRDLILKMLNDNMYKFVEDKMTKLHSDFHLWNMIFDDNGYVGVIDFERCRIGPPILDFRSNTPFNVPHSNHYASGFIDGYLKNNTIDDFVLKYNYYDIFSNVVGLPWSLENDEVNVQKILNKLNSFDEREDLLSKVPTWYVGKIF